MPRGNLDGQVLHGRGQLVDLRSREERLRTQGRRRREGWGGGGYRNDIVIAFMLFSPRRDSSGCKNTLLPKVNTSSSVEHGQLKSWNLRTAQMLYTRN